MGCDIHFALEKHNKATKEWEYIPSDIDVGRCYPLFELLAGVRGNVANAVKHPTGLPDDLSRGVKEGMALAAEMDFGDWDNPNRVYLGDHSFTVLYLKDLDKAEKLLLKGLAKGYYDEDEYGDFSYMRRMLDELRFELMKAGVFNKAETRLIVGFDS